MLGRISLLKLRRGGRKQWFYIHISFLISLGTQGYPKNKGFDTALWGLFPPPRNILPLDRHPHPPSAPPLAFWANRTSIVHRRSLHNVKGKDLSIPAKRSRKSATSSVVTLFFKYHAYTKLSIPFRSRYLTYHLLSSTLLPPC